MLSPEYLDDCANQLINLYSELENRIIADIVRRLLKTGDVTETAKWEILKAQELGLLYDDVLSLIASQTNKTNAEVKTLFENAGVETVNIDNEKYQKAGKVPVDVRQSESMRQVLEAGYQKTLGNLQNLTMTTAITSQTAFINASNSAYMMVTSGAFSYQDAIRTAIKEMAQKGVSVLTDTIKYEGINKKGQHYTHEDKIDVAIRRNILTGVGQTCKQVSLINAQENGFDLMEINAHSGARPSHAKWQGKRVSLSGRKGYLSLHDIGYGSAEGFGGCNCRHDWYPVDENDIPMYTDDQLKDFDAKNIEYNGKKYTQYEATQIQRRKEREIRDLKREAVAYDTAIKETDDEELKSKLKDDFTKTSNKLKDKEKALADFTKETGIKRDRFREQVQGFNRSVSSKSTWADKRNLSINNDNIDYMSRFTPRYSNQKNLRMSSATGGYNIPTKKVSNSKFDLYTDINADRKNKAVKLTEKQLLDIQNNLPKNFEMPTIAVVNFEKHNINANAIGGYDKNTGIMWINSKYDTKGKILEFVNKSQGRFANTTEYAPHLHEFGHKYYEDCINSLAISKNMSYNEVKKIIDRKIYNYVENKNDYLFIQNNISEYAQDGYNKNSFTEVIAECFSVRDTNEIAKEILSLLEGI